MVGLCSLFCLWCDYVLLDGSSQSDFVEREYLDELGWVRVLVYQLRECESIRQVSSRVWHGVAFHDHMLSVCVFGLAPWAFPVVSSYTLEVVREPAMS